MFLTKEKEKKLVILGQNGDVYARNAVIENIFPMLFKIAIRVARTKGDESEELVNVAVIRIIEYFNSFDPERGIRFSTYFGRAAEREMRNFRLSNQLMRIPEMAWKSEATREYAMRAMKTASLSRLGNDEEFDSLAEEDGPDGFDYIEAANIVRDVYQRLTAKQRSVFELRCKGLTYNEISKTLGFSRQNAQILFFRAVNDLRLMVDQPSQPSP